MTIELSDEEAKFVKKALIHSANVHVTFCKSETENGDVDRLYPIKETKEYCKVVNEICEKL
jgi:hypothetical protein